MIASTLKSQVQIANLSSSYEIPNCSLNIPVDISWTTPSPNVILNSLSFHSLPQAYSCYVFFPRIQFRHPPNCTFQKPGSYYWHSLSLYIQSITKFCWFYLINLSQIYWLFYKSITAFSFPGFWWPPYRCQPPPLTHPYFISLHPTKLFSILFPEWPFKNVNLNVYPCLKHILSSSLFWGPSRILHKLYRTWSFPVLEASSYCSLLLFSTPASSHTASLLIPQMHPAPFQFTVMSPSLSFACKTDS